MFQLDDYQRTRTWVRLHPGRAAAALRHLYRLDCWGDATDSDRRRARLLRQVFKAESRCWHCGNHTTDGEPGERCQERIAHDGPLVGLAVWKHLGLVARDQPATAAQRGVTVVTPATPVPMKMQGTNVTPPQGWHHMLD